jgi:hypothetical protein
MVGLNPPYEACACKCWCSCVQIAGQARNDKDLRARMAGQAHNNRDLPAHMAGLNPPYGCDIYMVLGVYVTTPVNCFGFSVSLK